MVYRGADNPVADRLVSDHGPAGPVHARTLTGETMTRQTDYAAALKTLERAEAKMRRAFKAWDKARAAEQRAGARLERKLYAPKRGTWPQLSGSQPCQFAGCHFPAEPGSDLCKFCRDDVCEGDES